MKTRRSALLIEFRIEFSVRARWLWRPSYTESRSTHIPVPRGEQDGASDIQEFVPLGKGGMNKIVYAEGSDTCLAWMSLSRLSSLWERA